MSASLILETIGKNAFFSTGWDPPPGGQVPSHKDYDIGEGYQVPGPPPPPEEKKSGLRFVLYGCGCLVVVIILVVGGGCAYLFIKGPPLMADLYEMTKPQFMSYLTDKHTEEQRKRFENAFDIFIKDWRSDKYDGFSEWAEKGPTKLFQGFQNIQADRKITVEESREWSRMVEEKLGSHGSETSEDRQE